MDLAALVDRAAFMSAETQLALEEALGTPAYDVNLSEEPTLIFTSDSSDPVTTRPHMLGTVSAQSHSWHWGWDNINNFPTPVVATAQAVRDRAADVPEITTAQLELADTPWLPLALTLAAKAVSGIWAHYPVSAGPHTEVWFLLENAPVDLGPAQARTLGSVIAQTLSTTPVSDHRRALREYASIRGFDFADDGDTVSLTASDGTAVVTLTNGSITGIKLSLGAAAEKAAETPAAEPTTKPAPAQPAPAPAEPEQEQPAPERPAPSPAQPEPKQAAPQPEPAPAQPAVPAPQPAPAPEPQPAPTAPAQSAPVEQQPAPAPVPQPQPVPQPEPQREEDKPAKKKGLFSRIFGR